MGGRSDRRKEGRKGEGTCCKVLGGIDAPEVV